jgi:RHS repeat-associated protein
MKWLGIGLCAALIVAPAQAGRLPIERLQRDIQLRYVHTTQSVEVDGKVVFLFEMPRNDAHLLTWAATPCSGLPPAYPPDNFYGERLLSEEAQYLVEDILLKFDLSRLWTYYVTVSEEYETTPVARPAFLDTPCTTSNYEAVFNDLRAFVDTLDTVRSRPAVSAVAGPLYYAAYELRMDSRQEEHAGCYRALLDSAYARTGGGGFFSDRYYSHPTFTGFLWDYREWPVLDEWQAYVDYYGIEFGEPSGEAMHFTQFVFRQALYFGQPDFDPITIWCVASDVIVQVESLGSGGCYPFGFSPETMGILQHLDTIGHDQWSVALETPREDVPGFPDPVEARIAWMRGWALNEERTYSVVKLLYRPLVEKPQGCEMCQDTPGKVVANDGMHFAIGLGHDGLNGLAGMLEMGTPKPGAGVASLDRLHLRSASEGVQATMEDGRLASVTAPQCRVDLAQLPDPNTASGFVAEFRMRQDGSSDFETDSTRKVVVVQGMYDPATAAAWAAGDFSDPGARWDDSVHVYEVVSGVVVKHTTFKLPFAENAPGSGVRMSFFPSPAWGPTDVENANGTVHRYYSKQLEDDGTATVSRWASDESYRMAEHTKETYTQQPWGWELTRTEASPWDTPIWTEYAYYTEENENGYGKLRQVIHSDGRWERYEYTTGGELCKTISPFGDAPADAEESLCRVRETTSEWSGDEVTTLDVERVLGVEVSRSYRVRSSTRTRHVRCAAPGADIHAAGNVTTTTTYEQNPDDGSPLTGRRVTRTERADGTLTLRDYPSAHREIEWSGEPDATGDAVVNGTRTDTQKNEFGHVVHREVRDVASSALTDSETAIAFDNTGRPIEWRNLGGAVRKIAMGACCGVESETERDGSTRFYEYDPEGHVVLATHADAQGEWIHERTVYDGAGRVTLRGFTDAEGAGLRPQDWQFSEHFTQRESYEYDLAGRLRSAMNAVGGITTHSLPETVGQHQVTTVTYPDGGTMVEEFYLDGQLCRRTGTAASHVAMEYGVEDGEVFAKTILLDDNGGSTRWSKTYTDFLGRSYKTVYSDGSREQTWFNAKGQAVKSVDRDGMVTLFAYNGKGAREVVALDRDGNGQIDYAGNDRIVKTLTQVAAAHGTTVRRTVTQAWDQDNADVPRTEAVQDVSDDGLQTWSTVDGQETHTVSVFDPAQTSRTDTVTYPDRAQTITTTIGGQMTRQVWKDCNGATLRTVDYTYGAFGDLVRQVDSRDGTAEFAYGAPGLLTTSTRRSRTDANDTLVESYTYDSSLRVTSVTHPDNSATYTEYALNGQVSRQYGAGIYPVEYAYDVQGRMTNLLTWQNFAAAAGVARTAWIYDSTSGQLARKEYDDGTHVDYTYTPGGRLKSRTWARGAVTEYAYDPLGLLTNVHYGTPDTPDVSYAYDRLGRLKTATNAHATYVYAYTGNLLTSETVTTSGRTNVIQRSHDAFNRLAGFQLDDRVPVTYGYDDAGRLASVGFGGMANSYNYGSDGLLTGHAIPGRLTVTRAYDGFNRLISLANATPDRPVSSYTYTHDALSRRTSMQMESGGQSAGAWQYEYDSLGQLTRARKTGGNATDRQHDYAYDDIGNRTRASVAGGTTWTYRASSLNAYTQIVASTESAPSPLRGTVFVIDGTARGASAVSSQTTALQYDADGNLVDDGRWSYAWDGENRLITAEEIAAPPERERLRVENRYDHMGRRIRKTVFDAADLGTPISDFRYIYDGWNVSSEVRSQQSEVSTNAYVWGLDLSGTLQGAGGVGGLLAAVFGGDPEPVEGLYTYDANGNVTDLVDANGDTVAHYEYSPFGELIRATGPAATTNPWRFSTKYADPETGLYYYGYRYYSPGLGRWLSRDPIGERGGPNLYGFAGNTGVNRVDSFGLDVFVADRALRIFMLEWTYKIRAMMHVYLAFNNEHMGSLWDATLRELGYAKGKGWQTFSFHPDSVRTGSGELNKVSVIYTGSSWVSANDRESDIVPIAKGEAHLTPVTQRECEQVAIFRAAHRSRLANPGGSLRNDRGYYSFLVNNCGSWAKSIIEEAGAVYPAAASRLNFGTGLSGPADWTLLPHAVYLVVAGGYEATAAAVQVVAGTFQVGRSIGQTVSASAIYTAGWVTSHAILKSDIPVIGSPGEERGGKIRVGVGFAF